MALILSKLKKAKGNKDKFTSLCPAHNDKESSLSITENKNKILLHCFAGCSPESIMKSIGLELTALFFESKPVDRVVIPLSTKKIIAEYSYQDEDGKELYQVVRYEPKEFRQRHKGITGEWVWNMDGIRRVLYHLPEILTTYADTIYFVEGEKDADKLWEWGQVATTSPGGANNWKPEYAQYLAGKRVVVIPDKDTAGYDYARQVIQSLQNKVSSVKCVILPGVVKDTYDWIEAGGDVETLPSLEQDVSVLFDSDKPNYQQDEDSIVWHKNIEGQTLSFRAESLRQERTGLHARVSIAYNNQILAWTLCNIERSDERIRLSNQAYEHLKKYLGT